MNAFITGSRSYGKPTADSDIDLVVLVDYATAEVLRGFSDQQSVAGPPVIRFGKLNIIAVTNEAEFAMWKVATETLRRKKNNEGRPIGRDEAKAFIDTLRICLEVPDRGDSQLEAAERYETREDDAFASL